MKYIVVSILVFVAGFSVNKYGFTSNSFENTTNVTEVIKEYPVNLIDFKLMLVDYIHHVCEKNKGKLAQFSSHVTECINAHDKAKQACTVKVFRLAPLSIETKEEIREYGQEYKECTLPYKNLLG